MNYWIYKFENNEELNLEQIRAGWVDIKKDSSVKEGDEVLFLEVGAKWNFFAAGDILITNESIIVVVTGFSQDGETLLEDYVYSLLGISDYTKPEEHFVSQFTPISGVEFAAIKQGKPYQKRTILGTVLNAMHPDHLRAYLNYIDLEDPAIRIGGADLDKTLELLINYLDFAIIQPALYLQESSQLLSRIVSEEDLEHIGFADSIEKIDTNSKQMIMPQVALINQYLEVLKKIKDKKSELMSIEEESGFKELFKNAPLPITLKKT